MVGLPGMWDDLAVWKRWTLKAFALPAVMLWDQIRMAFVDSGTVWDQALFVIACGAAVIAGYVLIISGVVRHNKRNAQRATVPAVPGPRSAQPEPWIAPPKPVPAPSATIKQDVMSAPAVWITEDEALWMVRSSSSVQSRLPAEPLAIDKVVRALAGSPMTLRDRRANEISRHLLRKFKTDCPSGVRSGLYDRQRLEEWINQQAYDDPQPSTNR